jgi:hypothetical protein
MPRRTSTASGVSSMAMIDHAALQHERATAVRLAVQRGGASDLGAFIPMRMAGVFRRGAPRPPPR